MEGHEEDSDNGDAEHEQSEELLSRVQDGGAEFLAVSLGDADALDNITPTYTCEQVFAILKRSSCWNTPLTTIFHLGNSQAGIRLVSVDDVGDLWRGSRDRRLGDHADGSSVACCSGRMALIRMDDRVGGIHRLCGNVYRGLFMGYLAFPTTFLASARSLTTLICRSMCGCIWEAGVVFCGVVLHRRVWAAECVHAF